MIVRTLKIRTLGLVTKIKRKDYDYGSTTNWPAITGK